MGYQRPLAIRAPQVFLIGGPSGHLAQPGPGKATLISAAPPSGGIYAFVEVKPWN